ncbi:MAG: 16S rRNA (guanine(527)-N(7))-methyltransferase RsmG [Thermoguttaceae bacterium]|jgi:16S rRNA (guanine527-N7)-methyltransferase
MFEHNESELNPGNGEPEKPAGSVELSDAEAQTSEVAPEPANNAVEARESKTLEEALEKYNITLPAEQVRLLNEYCDLLWTWNERLNLTRHTTYDKFVSRDLIDSMHLAALLQDGEHVLDVGSGGGVPGLVVAILRPDVVVELCEATGKKAEALGQMIDELGLDLPVWYSKAQDLVRERHFHTLTVRAVDRMHKLLSMFRTSWHCFERILMIKGPRWVDERSEARQHNMFKRLALRKIDEYIAPGPDGAFTSVILQVCPKKKLDEIKRRAVELSEGKPYSGAVEELVVDNSRQNLQVNERKEKRRGYVKFRNNRDADNKQASESRVYARKNGKPPKGWTGKKSEFRSEAQSDRPQGRHDAAKRDWRGSSKRSKFKKRGDRNGNSHNGK